MALPFAKPTTAPASGAATPPDPYPDGPGYPGGVDAKGYKWAFTLYSVVFLLVLTIGLVLYLASFFSGR